jgi:hypothetical protein
MPRKRKSISKRTRFEVFKRDGFTCQYCGRTPPIVILVIDHIVAHAAGGPDDQLNLVTSCEDCNSGKSDKDLKQVLPSLADQIARRREKEEQVKEYNTFLMEIRDAEIAALDKIGTYWFDIFEGAKGKYRFNPSSEPAGSIRTFLKRLTVAEILDAIDIAHARCGGGYHSSGTVRRPFLYFCGVCWRKIKGEER